VEAGELRFMHDDVQKDLLAMVIAYMGQRCRDRGYRLHIVGVAAHDTIMTISVSIHSGVTVR
jgi:hypothetical protein